MRLIDEDKLYAELKERSDAALKWYNEETDENNKTKAAATVITFCEVKLTLDEQPTIDAVPVVKCKDCKFNYANYIPSEDSCFKFVDLPINKDFYCACGEIFDEKYNGNETDEPSEKQDDIPEFETLDDLIDYFGSIQNFSED